MTETATYNPLLQVTVDGVTYPFDFDAVNGRQMALILKWCGISMADMAEAISTGGSDTLAAVAAAIFLSVDQAKGPLSSDQAVAVMEQVGVHSSAAEWDVQPGEKPAPRKAPVKKAPAKKPPARTRKAAAK